MAIGARIRELLEEFAANGQFEDRDRAALSLAYLYADLIANAEGKNGETLTVKRLGPELHRLLNDLGLTPAGRKAPAKPAEEVISDGVPGSNVIALRGQFGRPGTRQHGA